MEKSWREDEEATESELRSVGVTLITIASFSVAAIAALIVILAT